MKKTILFLCFIGLLIYTSCHKEPETSQAPDVMALSGASSTMDSIVMLPYTIPNITNKERAHEALAYALSRAMYDSEKFRHYLFDHMASTEVYYSEIMICSAKDDLLSDGTKIGDLLNSYLSTPSTAGGSDGNPLQTIINYDKLVMTKISDVHFRTPWDPVNEILPVVSLKAGSFGFSMFANGSIAESNNFDGKNVYSLIVTTSQSNSLINKSTGFDINGRSFENLFGFAYNNCNAVYNFIASQPDFCGNASYALINAYNIEDLFENNCLIPAPDPDDPDDPDDPNDPPFDPNCPRSNWKQNYNSFEGFWLGNMATFNEIANQPCPGGETKFSFSWKWLFGTNGSTNGSRNRSFNRSLNEVVNPGIKKYKEVCVIWVWTIKNGKFVKVCQVAAKVEDGYIQDPYPEYIDIYQPLFSDHNKLENSWEPNVQGRFLAVGIIEFDHENCATSNQTTMTQQLMIQLQFGKKDSASGGINWGSSTSTSTNHTVTGTAVVELGVADFGYCDEYGGGTTGYKYPNIIGFTGDAVYVHLYAPKVD